VIRFKAKAKKTQIMLYAASGKRVSLRTVNAKTGKKKVLIRIGRGIRLRKIELVSVGRVR